MQNSNSANPIWDFWYDDENEKFYLLYEELEKNKSTLKLAEREVLE